MRTPRNGASTSLDLIPSPRRLGVNEDPKVLRVEPDEHQQMAAKHAAALSAS